MCGIAARDKKKSPARRRNPRRTTPGDRVCVSVGEGWSAPSALTARLQVYTNDSPPMQSRDLGVIGSKRAMMAATDAEMKARNGPAECRARTHLYSNKMDLRRNSTLAFVHKLFIFIKFLCVG